MPVNHDSRWWFQWCLFATSTWANDPILTLNNGLFNLLLDHQFGGHMFSYVFFQTIFFSFRQWLTFNLFLGGICIFRRKNTVSSFFRNGSSLDSQIQVMIQPDFCFASSWLHKSSRKISPNYGSEVGEICYRTSQELSLNMEILRFWLIFFTIYGVLNISFVGTCLRTTPFTYGITFIPICNPIYTLIP